MQVEKRTIKAAIMTGLTDIATGIIMYFTKAGDWYYSHFHVFGIFGFSMLAYGLWHLYFLRREEDG